MSKTISNEKSLGGIVFHRSAWVKEGKDNNRSWTERERGQMPSHSLKRVHCLGQRWLLTPGSHGTGRVAGAARGMGGRRQCNAGAGLRHTQLSLQCTFTSEFNHAPKTANFADPDFKAAASRKEAKDARRLLQRGGPGPHQMQEDREFGGDGGAYGAGGGGGIGRASNHASVAPAQLHYQFASFERHTSGALWV
eukprot:896519-Pelagomonas_calceolata.AAC.8